MKYLVDVRADTFFSVYVDADSEECAVEKAIEQFEKTDRNKFEYWIYPDEVNVYDKNGCEL